MDGFVFNYSVLIYCRFQRNTKVTFKYAYICCVLYYGSEYEFVVLIIFCLLLFVSVP